jgi:nicotinamidase/pyrazinamidase
MPVLSNWAAAAHQAGIPVFVSRDWHPPKTTHFQEFGGVWPPHCVIGTHGAEFHPGLRLPAAAIVVSKGMGETEDAYSAFQARDDSETPFETLLRQRGVRTLFVMGLATDYCVKQSVLDGLAHGFGINVVPEGIRAVNLQADDGQQALDQMWRAGARLTS